VKGQPRVARATGKSTSPIDPEAVQSVLSAEDLATLQAIEKRLLWISTMMIHYANNIRPSAEKSKVGGHQASSASVSTIMTALYFHFLKAGDRVSIKPHASPIFHAAQYLLGRLDREYLTTLREFKGLQAYPSRTKDPDPVDFSTGSVGLGAVAPAFAALAARYAELHFGEVTSNRFLALIGDAELDEGNIWEAVAEEALRGLSNVIWIIDLNRQSLDRVIPGVRAAHLKALFAGAGWRVFEAKYGSILQAAMDASPNDALRRRIDEMSNEEYQALIRIRNGAELRTRLTDVVDATYRRDLIETLSGIADDDLRTVASNLGGHDLPALIDTLEQADAVTDSPSVIFAYTIKGFGLPMAGDPLNHSQLLTQDQIDGVRESMGLDADDPWAVFADNTEPAKWIAKSAERLGPGRTGSEGLTIPVVPTSLDTRNPAVTSTQEALGRTLTRLADFPEARARIVTMSPDVATSTHLSGWINKVGVFSQQQATDYEDSAQRLLKWQPNPEGQHIELGISEMNLFMALSQFGLAQELTGQHLIPIGTVYDPFVCRGLDALIYGLYVGARMIFAGTPAGVSLSPEGGAHQSTVTPSLGIELPGVRFYEPAFSHEVEWTLLDAIERCSDRANGSSTYLRLSTKAIDSGLASTVLARTDAACCAVGTG
jgi:pyruvate dehydrogenase E1 component